MKKNSTGVWRISESMQMCKPARRPRVNSLPRHSNSAGYTPAVPNLHLFGLGAVASLEEKLKRHYGMKYALCLSNASTGLLALGLALGLKSKEFVTTPYTYGASI